MSAITEPDNPRGEIVGTHDRGGLALVLAGGGARAAYQVGLLRFLARRFPQLSLPIITGVSAGAVNAAHLAQHQGSLSESVEDLASLWTRLSPERVFRADASSLLWNVLRSGTALISGGGQGPSVKGMVDTAPLREFLEEALVPVGGELTGVQRNLDRGRLRAVAISTTSYTTGQSVIWVDGRSIETWERPMRRSVHSPLTVDHIMASAALPLFFPAVQIGKHWYGDGSVRLAAPLSPALHLGAHKILAVSPRHESSPAEADRPSIVGYPPPAQVLGVLYNSVFLDLIDQDVVRLERMNTVLRGLTEEQRGGMRIVQLLVVRPSRDLGRLARHYEPRLPSAFRYLSRGLGTRRTLSPDLLSMVMFQDDYIRDLIALGEADAAAKEEEIVAFIES